MKKLLILTVCLMFFVNIPSAVCQVTMIKQDKECKIDSYSKIVLWYDYSGSHYSLYSSTPESFTVGISLGRTKSEAINRLSEIMEACKSGNNFFYKDATKDSYNFYVEGSGKYRVMDTSSHKGYVYIESFQKAISWVQNVKE